MLLRSFPREMEQGDACFGYGRAPPWRFSVWLGRDESCGKRFLFGVLERGGVEL